MKNCCIQKFKQTNNSKNKAYAMYRHHPPLSGRYSFDVCLLFISK